jgi:hypothetical protein
LLMWLVARLPFKVGDDHRHIVNCQPRPQPKEGSRELSWHFWMLAGEHLDELWSVDIEVRQPHAVHHVIPLETEKVLMLMMIKMRV